MIVLNDTLSLSFGTSLVSSRKKSAETPLALLDTVALVKAHYFFHLNPIRIGCACWLQTAARRKPQKRLERSWNTAPFF
jgi:hypothetical protein